MIQFSTTRYLLILVLLLVTPWVTRAQAVPEGFSVESGTDLVWSPSTGRPVRVGGALYEFLTSNGAVFGFPREVEGKLVLTMTSSQHNMLSTEGQGLQVWVSGRRLDVVIAASARSSAASSTATSSTVTTPTVEVDPAAPGNRATKRSSYTLKRLNITSFPYRVEVVGEVTQPKVLKSGEKHPLVLFLHGRHATCYIGWPDGFDTGDWPCQEGFEPIPSYKGYRYVADILASQGYIVVSISANGINGQDWQVEDGGAAARSMLIRHHLKLWAGWNSQGGGPWNGTDFLGKIDMQKVVLVGHSRGGEGVNRAAIDGSKSDLYKIVGLVSYGPTAFGRQVMPDIHSATILPTCDGDVSDLQGQAYIDDSRDIAYSEALRSAVIALGCNHNYFNTEWTPGQAKAPAWDDWWDDSDPACGSKKKKRLTAEEQQKVGAAYTLALVRLAVEKDADMLQFLDGSYVRPEAIGRADVATHAVGGAGNRLLYRAEESGNVVLSKGMTGGDCVGYPSNWLGSGSSDTFSKCYDDYFASPHWLPRYYAPSHPSPQATSLEWSKAGATARFNIRSGPVNLTSHDWVDVRVAKKPEEAAARLDLLIRDDKGRTTTLLTSLSTIKGWPLIYNVYERVHARALRGSLESVRSSGVVDLSKIVAVEVVARNASGGVWVIDIAASQAQIVTPVDLDLPVVSVEDKIIKVTEGDGLKTVYLNVTVDRPLTLPASIWLTVGGNGYQVNMTAGSTVAQIPVDIAGDNIYAYSGSFGSLSVGALTGAVTSNYIGGGLTVKEDEKPPTLSVEQSMVTARGGQSLRWKLRLSTATARTGYSFSFVRPDGKELTTDDVPQSWVESIYWDIPSKPTRLSTLSRRGASVYVSFPYGIKTATLLVPISSDRKANGNETVILRSSSRATSDKKRLTLIGTVLGDD